MRSRLKADVNPAFDDPLSAKLTPGYTKTAMALDSIASSLVVDRLRAADFRDLEADEWYKHVIIYRRVFLIPDMHFESTFRSKWSTLPLRDALLVYDNTNEVHGKLSVTDLSYTWDKAMQLMDALLLLLFSLERE